MLIIRWLFSVFLVWGGGGEYVNYSSSVPTTFGQDCRSAACATYTCWLAWVPSVTERTRSFFRILIMRKSGENQSYIDQAGACRASDSPTPESVGFFFFLVLAQTLVRPLVPSPKQVHTSARMRRLGNLMVGFSFKTNCMEFYYIKEKGKKENKKGIT